MKILAVALGVTNALTCTYTIKGYGAAACSGTPSSSESFSRKVDACEKNSNLNKYQKCTSCETSTFIVNTYDTANDNTCTGAGTAVTMSWNKCNQDSAGDHWYPTKRASNLALGGVVAMATIYFA